MTILPAWQPLTASAYDVSTRSTYRPQYSTTQDQLWHYYYHLEEFAAAVTWKANALSRVRLVAAKKMPGVDEPIPLPPDDPATQAVERLAGGIGGQSQLMREMGVHFNVPGEGWLVGTVDELGDEKWDVMSADEIDVNKDRMTGTQIVKRRVSDTGRDRDDYEIMPPDTVVVRFWKPNERFGYLATSTAAHAISAMAELEVVNNRIVSELTSRLAWNGIVVYDKGKLSFGRSPNPASAESVDPFAEVFAATASNGIRDPQSPEATLPIPIGVDLGDLTDTSLDDLIKFIQPNQEITDKLVELRDSSIKRIATVMDLPSDILLGVGGMNHWGAAQIEESGIKLHIAPDAELEAHSFTLGYLYPTLRAQNVPIIDPTDGGRRIIWYDPSDIVQHPNKSANALQAYDRLEISGDALRREVGFSEGDKPDGTELADMVNKLRYREAGHAPDTTNEDVTAGDMVEAEEDTPPAPPPPDTPQGDTPSTPGPTPDTDVQDAPPSVEAGV